MRLSVECHEVNITIVQNQCAELWHDFWLVVTFLLPMIMSIRSCKQDTCVYRDSCIYSCSIRSYTYMNQNEEILLSSYSTDLKVLRGL